VAEEGRSGGGSASGSEPSILYPDFQVVSVSDSGFANVNQESQRR
jgi:hypothetical protein